MHDKSNNVRSNLDVRFTTQHFADLTEAERVMMMAQVELEMTELDVYSVFLKKLTRTLDKVSYG